MLEGCNSRADNSGSSGPIRSIIELIRDLIVTYNLTKFDAHWLIFVDSAIFTNSRANNSRFSASICPIIQDLMGIYIVAKTGTD